jgi:hypothetical protein
MAKFICTFKDPDYATEGEYMNAASATVALKDKFIEYDEYISVEFDTATGAARVLPVGSR